MTEIVADGLHLASAKKAEDVWMRPCSLDGRLDTRLNLCGHHVKKTNKQTDTKTLCQNIEGISVF